MIRLISFLICFIAASAQAETMRLAVTTSFHNSGLSDLLLPAIRADLGLHVQLLVVGTGQALRLGRAGDVDAVLVHSKTAEDAFVSAGFASHRRPIMYNDFVLIGPASDPAAIRQQATSKMLYAALPTPRSASLVAATIAAPIKRNAGFGRQRRCNRKPLLLGISRWAWAWVPA